MLHLRFGAWSQAGTAIVIGLLTIAFPVTPARSQHASDNPVASADDAFGLTLGLESIGLYGPGGIRGFNPQTAGNVRIDGLYFDQQGPLSNRVVEGSTIRIGVSEVGYAFPAPTGIVDYDLRRPGTDTPAATVVASAGPFQAHGLSIDGSLPLISSELQLPLGASYQVSTPSTNPGYTSTVLNFGATPQWKPNDQLTVRALFDWQQITKQRTLPIVFTAGDFLPAYTPRGYYGQNWAEGRSLSENYGGLAIAQLSEHWSLAAGLFKSISESPISYSDIYANTQPDGSAEQFIVGYPNQRIASSSGEARLTGHFGSDSLRHEVDFLVRGRDTLALYGGSDVVDVGPALIDQGVQVPEPAFSYSARTNDHTDLWSAGLAYRVQWKDRGEFAIGVQQENYQKDVSVGDGPEARLTDRPLRAYGTGAIAISDKLTAYAGYTQGLEDSGVAPAGAENRGAILPASQTWQTDAGIRYLLTPQVKLIAGIFEIEKPYFNFDTNDIDRTLGEQRARGVELSLSGKLITNLDVTAGMLLGRVAIIGPNLAAEGVGSTAFGQPRIQLAINANYQLARLPGFSADLAVQHFGISPASVDGVTQNPAQTVLALGGRYQFTILGHPATLRVQIQNLTNFYWWNMGYSPGFFQAPSRYFFGYLTADV